MERGGGRVQGQEKEQRRARSPGGGRPVGTSPVGPRRPATRHHLIDRFDLVHHSRFVFTSLLDRPDLISLAEAQRTPSIVYRSVDSLPEPAAEPEFPAHSYQMKLIPLAVAAARKDIKYRREGFEMMEAAAHIAAVRADLF